MTNPPLPSIRFWLRIGDVPTGPLDVAQVHAELVAGRATWQTSACPVGGNNWLPLHKMPGLGPEADPATGGGSGPAQADQKISPVSTSVEPMRGELSQDKEASETPVPPAATDTGVWRGVIGLAMVVVFVGGLYWGGARVTSLFGGQKPGASATPPGINPNPVTSQPPTPPPTTQKAATPPAGDTPSMWNLAGPPRLPAYMQNPASLLVGSWRWDGGGGFSSTFAFEAGGTFTYYTAGADPLLNLPVAGCEASGRWSVRDGTLLVEFTGASPPALLPLFRGRTNRSPVRFDTENVVQLSGVEGDAVTRAYTRVR